MKRLAISLFIVSLFSSVAWAGSTCTGADSKTKAVVYGNCAYGNLTAYDSVTHAYVYGTCSDGGSMSGWDSKTGAWVWGSCL